MKTYKEWRAVGVYVEGEQTCREEGLWRPRKSEAREDAFDMKWSNLPYEEVFVERRTVSRPVRVR